MIKKLVILGMILYFPSLSWANPHAEDKEYLYQVGILLARTEYYCNEPLQPADLKSIILWVETEYPPVYVSINEETSRSADTINLRDVPLYALKTEIERLQSLPTSWQTNPQQKEAVAKQCQQLLLYKRKVVYLSQGY